MEQADSTASIHPSTSAPNLTPSARNHSAGLLTLLERIPHPVIMRTTNDFGQSDFASQINLEPQPANLYPPFNVDFWQQNFSTVNWESETFPFLDSGLIPAAFTDTYNENGFTTEDFQQEYRASSLTVQPLVPSVKTPAGTRTFEGEVENRSNSNLETPGTYYIENESGRLLRGKRRRLLRRTIPHRVPNTPLTFSLEAPTILATDSSTDTYINSIAYELMAQTFRRVCLNSNTFLAFSSDVFPTSQDLSTLVGIYIKVFHPILPMLHIASFRESDRPWELLLCMAAIGSHFLEPQLSAQFSISIHEFVRRALCLAKEDGSYVDRSPLNRIQVVLLHGIGLAYSGDERLCRSAMEMHQEIAALCVDVQSTSISALDDDDWVKWAEAEERTRACHVAWLLHCVWRFQFDQRPTLKPEDIKLPLPCHEKIWAADKHEWPRMMTSYPHMPTLLSTVQLLYIEKRLPNDLGEFSRILLIYGIISRCWEVESYYSQDLTSWTPTAQRESLDSFQSKVRQSTWLPSFPLYRQWRSSACDCFDVLHWSANATVGNLSGMEHPTVLHLHLSRVVLLTPWKEIKSLAQLLVKRGRVQAEDDTRELQDIIRRWVTQDQYKARLAMVHAGVLFWHVRRFSASAFHEPSAIGLATLALWAFASFSPRPLADRYTDPSRQEEQHRAHAGWNDLATENNDIDDTSENEESQGCNIILLDRPTDDELVQRFVLKGQALRMLANMDGVGNLFGERASRLVLLQGRKLLNTLDWGDRTRWLILLTGLLDMT